MNFRNSGILALLLATSTLGGRQSDLQRVLSEPKTVAGRTVKLVGIAEIVGAEFWLYPNATEAKKGGKSVFISRDLNGQLYEELDNHWVEVTGVVDTTAHGPMGVSPCEIILKYVEVLPYSPLVDRHISGVFRNETLYTIDLKFATPTGQGKILDFPAGQIDSAWIARGHIVATISAGKIVAEGELVGDESDRRHFDAEKRTYYYRIRAGKVEMVLPSEGRRWLPVKR